MALYGNNPTATATVGANTNVVTIAGIDLSLVTPGMTINLGARDRKAGDAWIIASVAPTGSNGGTVTTQGNITTAYNSVPFLIDTTGYLGTDASYAAAVGLAILSALSTLLGVATNLYSGARQLVLDKVAATAVSRIVFSIAGRAWSAFEHRTLTFTPTGGQATSIETMGLRASPDGTTWADALLVDLSNGTGDLRKGAVVMASAATTDLGSAPAGKVAITGSAAIASFGPGRHLERIVHIVDGGATLTHNATSLDLPGRANIATRAGDRFGATSDGSGNWRVTFYQRADGSLVGFTPVQQGTGVGQLANAVKIGNSAVGPKITVDAADFGKLWCDQLAPSALSGASYAKLPNGLIVQFGYSNAAADATITLPVAFPNGSLNSFACVQSTAGPGTIFSVHASVASGQSVVFRRRYYNGTTVGASSDGFWWFVIGF